MKKLNWGKALQILLITPILLMAAASLMVALTGGLGMLEKGLSLGGVLLILIFIALGLSPACLVVAILAEPPIVMFRATLFRFVLVGLVFGCVVAIIFLSYALATVGHPGLSGILLVGTPLVLGIYQSLRIRSLLKAANPSLQPSRLRRPAEL